MNTDISKHKHMKNNSQQPPCFEMVGYLKDIVPMYLPPVVDQGETTDVKIFETTHLN
jgi:hypothetical protein